MSLLVSDIVTNARTLMHDLKNGHYVREFLNEQANGVNLTFQVRNRHLLQAADGAPADVAFLVNQVAVAIATLDKDAGLITLGAAPSANNQVEARYYFEMATDTEWLEFFKLGAGFVGDTTVYTALANQTGFASGLATAVKLFAAAQASRALASLTHWYYSANAGNKGFDKNQISKKFMEQAKDFEEQAADARLKYYKAFDANQAPAFAYTGPARGTRYWEPKR